LNIPLRICYVLGELTYIRGSSEPLFGASGLLWAKVHSTRKDIGVELLVINLGNRLLTEERDK
jgi:hypothetical protein